MVEVMGNTFDDDDFFADLQHDLDAKAEVLEAKKPVKQITGNTPEEQPVKRTLFLGDPWEDKLVVDPKGWAIANHANLAHTIRCHGEWTETLAYNSFTGRKILLKPIPGTPVDRSFKPREIEDRDILSATSWFNRNLFPRAAKSQVADAIDDVVFDAIINPVKHFLEDCEAAWDSQSRLADWLTLYCGVEVEDPMHKQYVEEVGIKWAVSAVARVMEPGCKADGVLILEGSQGAGKSTAAKVLAGTEFFGDSLPPMHSKEASGYVRGRWIIELAELANVSKAEVEVVKAFISRSEERFRPPYGRNEVTFPRQCVFIGSTNRTDYLRDDTGNRRFWPVKVGKIDTEGLQRDRVQLWGEAVHRYRKGEKWWLTRAAETIAAAETKARLIDDPWTSEVLSKVMGKSETCVSAILSDMLIEVGRRDRLMSNRVVSILLQNGWARDGQFNTAANRGQARFVKKG